MSPAEAALYARLRSRAALLQPDLARALLQAYEAIRQALTEAELAAAIRSGYVEALLSDATLDPAFRPLRSTMDEGVLAAAKAGKASLPPGLRSTFDTLNPAIVEAARRLNTRVVQGLKEGVRESVRQHVIAGLEAGQNPRAVARGVKTVVGLAPRQEQYIANFRRELQTGDRAALDRVLRRGVIRTPDGTEIVRRAHAGGQGLSGRDIDAIRMSRDAPDHKPLTKDQIERMTEAYRRRMLALNAETQTRTMALDAQRLGQRGSWEDAADQGIVDRSRLRRTWVAVDDERTRPEHAAMDGTEVGFDEPYPNGQMVPGETDYNCRCIERVTLAREALVP